MNELQGFRRHPSIIFRIIGIREHMQASPPLQLRELHVDAPLSRIPKSIGQLKYLEWMELHAWLGQVLNLIGAFTYEVTILNLTGR